METIDENDNRDSRREKSEKRENVQMGEKRDTEKIGSVKCQMVVIR